MPFSLRSSYEDVSLFIQDNKGNNLGNKTTAHLSIMKLRESGENDIIKSFLKGFSHKSLMKFDIKMAADGSCSTLDTADTLLCSLCMCGATAALQCHCTSRSVSWDLLTTDN